VSETGDAVTLVISRTPHPGRDEELGRWCEDVVREAASKPGHLGAGILRPGAPGGSWTVVARYESEQSLAAWRASPELARALARVKTLALPPRVLERHGLEPFFETPRALDAPRVPPRWKMALATWMAIYPMILGLSIVTGPILGDLPLPVRLLVTTGLMVPVMTWAVMPLVTRLLRGWLYA
jgi:antibiotic biosynthesis monooxygenase (ABM) superfamily enzyme